jgi:uncharacterized heparinase superfamily protein
MIEIPAERDLPPELRPAAQQILAEAEHVLAHEVDYLGSGMVSLGPEIDWHRDFKSGYRWPLCFYQDLQVIRSADSSDAKVPWELSRGHQLLILARAARLYEDDRFAIELEEQLESWQRHNPPGIGINWVNAMEAAIRSLNWLWALGTLEGVRPLRNSLRESVCRSLQVHGRHMAANLEGNTRLRNNHYLADVLGLLALGACIDGDPAAPKWFRFAHRELERQIMLQVLPDGVGFEASLPYHGLALEMFLLGWLIAHRAGRPLSGSYSDQLVRMLEVSRAVRHPDGRSPVFGDLDSGRVLPAGFAREPTHDNLLDLGSALLHLPRSLPSGHTHPEVAWTLGVPTWRRLDRSVRTERPYVNAFPGGGLYVLRSDDVHLVARWGGVGQNGVGGHGHNDLSSYELSYGIPFLVDPGTYVYTADPIARDEFRSARAHNVAVVDGLDMHEIPPQCPFAMPSSTRFVVDVWEDRAETALLSGWHDGYSRDLASIVCRRTISLDKRTHVAEVADEVSGDGHHVVESLLHLAPGTAARMTSRAGARVRCSDRELAVVFAGADVVAVEDGWISSNYGSRERAPVIRATAHAPLPLRLSYRMVPA